MDAAKAKDGQVRMTRETCAFSALPQVFIASAVAFILAVVVSLAFLPGMSAGFPAVESAWTGTAYAAEASDGNEGDSASEPASEGTADQASNDEAVADGVSDEAAADGASDEEVVTEEIEDDEVPMAQAIGVGRNIQSVIIVGVVLVVIAFIFFMRRMNKNMDVMRHRFR